MTKSERIAQLITRYNLGEITAVERQELMEWVNQSDNHRLEFERLTDRGAMDNFLAFKQMRQKALNETPSRKVVAMGQWTRYAAASVLILVALGLTLRYLNRGKDKGVEVSPEQLIATNDAPPGKFSAKLRLANGREIVLDSASLGLLAQQGGTNIYNKDGQLQYDAGAITGREMLYNTLETGPGQTYPLTLADGSRIWLNSKSSVRFPVSFTNTAERVIEMKGEVYFEVAKNTKQPFVAKILDADNRGSEVRVLGTHFNINAYDDEPSVKATLLEGSIKFVQPLSNKEQLLKPGQQVSLDENRNLTVLRNVDTSSVISWRYEMFSFKSFDFKTIMRQLSRWYGVEIVYQGNIPKMTLSGSVRRNRNLSEVLKALEANGIQFKVEGKKVTVL